MAGGLEAPGAPEGVKINILGRFLGVGEDGAWTVEGPYDVASQDVGWLFVYQATINHEINYIKWRGQYVERRIGSEHGSKCQRRLDKTPRGTFHVCCWRYRARLG